MLALALLFLSIPTFAIDANYCPERLTVTYARISAMFSLDVDSDLPQIENARRALEKLNPEVYRDVVLRRAQTTRSECNYAQENSDRFSIKLMSVYDRDLARVIINVGPYTYWIYHDLDSYSAAGVKLKGVLTVPVEAILKLGNPVRVGWALRPLVH